MAVVDSTVDLLNAARAAHRRRDWHASYEAYTRAGDTARLVTDDLDAFARALEERGIELEFSPRTIDSIELKIAFFTDPAGVRVELTEGLDLY